MNLNDRKILIRTKYFVLSQEKFFLKNKISQISRIEDHSNLFKFDDPLKNNRIKCQDNKKLLK